MDMYSGGLSLEGSGVKALDMSKLKRHHVSELPEEQYERFMEAQESFLEHRYSQMPDTSSNPTYKEYASVQVNGEVVATIDNHGWVASSNAVGAMLRDGLPDSANWINSGPALAQARAVYIADLMGGEVGTAPTAMTQNAFNGTPQPKVIVDVQAMMQDPMYDSLQKLQQQRMAYLSSQDQASSYTTVV